MNPLDALSAMTKVSAPLSQMDGMPALSNLTNIPGIATGPVNAITENFNLLQPHEVQPIASPTVSSNGSPNTWGHMVQQMVMDVNSKQQSATAAVNDVLQGGPTPVHEAMVASEEASLSFEMLSQMRNKVVDAYQQIMQMQV